MKKLIISALLLTVACLSQAGDQKPALVAPAGAVPFPDPAIAPAPKPVFDVRNYGAKGDGTTYDTAAIQKAIDACEGTGGSVLLSNGKFRSATVELKGKMTLYIAKDAVLLGGTEPGDYPKKFPYAESENIGGRWNQYSILYADKADGLTIDGGGVIDGQGKLVKMTGKEEQRPLLIRIYRSKNVTVRNVTLQNPRMWTQLYDQCQNLLIEFIKVHSVGVANADGVDILDCHDVVIRNNHFDADDDCITLKSHSLYGIKNVRVENNIVINHAANGIKIGTGTIGPIENLQYINNTVQCAALGGLCIESVDGSVLKNVVVRNLLLNNCSQPIFIRLANRTETYRGLLPQNKNAAIGPGSIENVTIEDVRITGTRSKNASSTITGIPGARLKNITLKNIQVEMPGGIDKIPAHPPEKVGDYPQSNLFGNTPAYGFYVRHADNVKFENVSIGIRKPDARKWLVAEDATVTTTNCVSSTPRKRERREPAR